MVAPMGCCGQSGQSLNPAKPIFLLPWGCFSLTSRGTGRGAALCSQLPVMHEEGSVCSGTVLVARQLSHQSMCTLLGCLLEAAYTMLWTLPHLPLHSHKAWKCSFTDSQCQELSHNAEKQGPTFCTSPILTLAGAAGAPWVWPAMGSTESWSWLFLLSSQQTPHSHSLSPVQYRQTKLWLFLTCWEAVQGHC